jgi:hypothetical protein
VQSYAVTIDSVEAFTGIDFFPGLPDSIEQQVESRKDVSAWTFSGYSAVPDDSDTLIPDDSSGNVTVYVTATGTKYHLAGCRYLSDSKIPLSLSEAKAQGYTPCCTPPE